MGRKQAQAGPHRKIQLADGRVALISPADAHVVAQHRWFAGGGGQEYAITHLGTGAARRNVYMHRLIMGAGPDDVVDHINGNPLDNRRENLRLTTRSMNMANRARTTNSTGFRGVAHFPKLGRYQARVICSGGTYRGPYRKTARKAAEDWDAMARGIFGQHATFNFPRPGERGVVSVVRDTMTEGSRS